MHWLLLALAPAASTEPVFWKERNFNSAHLVPDDAAASHFRRLMPQVGVDAIVLWTQTVVCTELLKGVDGLL